jgi:hypothetical protein
MEIRKYRILEWTSVFTRGAPVVEYELQVLPNAIAHDDWMTLGTSSTLDKARKALLFHMPNDSAGLG